MQGFHFELDDDMVEDDEDRELSQDIINNAKLSEGYLTLARDIKVMEPISPEDVYKVWTSTLGKHLFTLTLSVLAIFWLHQIDDWHMRFC